MPATEPFALSSHDASTALAALALPGAAGQLPDLVYEGPGGPVHLASTDRPPVTRLWGPSVPIATFDVGTASRGDAQLLRRGPQPAVSGAIGRQPVTIRVSAHADARTGALTVALGTARYELVATGILPRVTLHRDDLTELASFAVLGRRAHRIAPDATPDEVALVVFLVRFAPRLAYRR